jgi:hypothetical protein
MVSYSNKLKRSFKIKAIAMKKQKFFFFSGYFIRYFLYYISFFNLILFVIHFYAPYFIPCSSPSTIQLLYIPHLLPHPIYMWMAPSPIPPDLYTPPGAFSLLTFRCFISEWTQTVQSATVCVFRASYQLVYAACLVAQCLRDQGPG